MVPQLELLFSVSVPLLRCLLDIVVDRLLPSRLPQVLVTAAEDSLIGGRRELATADNLTVIVN